MIQAYSCDVSLTTERTTVELGSRVAMTCKVCPGNSIVKINLTGMQIADYWKPLNFYSVTNTSAYSISTDILNNISHIYLTVLSLTKDQAGTYTCQIVGTQNQSSVTLLYAVPVNYVEMIPRDKVSLLNNVTTNMFSCTSSTGRPTPVIRWYTDNKTPGYYADDSDITTLASSITNSSASGDTTTSHLTFTPSTDDHGQMLYCNVSNGYGQIMSNTTPLIEILRLPSKPVIFHNANLVNGSITVMENKTLSLNCVSEGNPNPTITWITPSFSRSTPVLTITNIQTNDTGMYTCRANSTLSPTNSIPFENNITTLLSTEVICTYEYVKQIAITHNSNNT
ncbi:roundabout homolog 1-like [Dreissena polymorpha]|uniref:roundabout homolog 1-like n=1 Tax=Dreissena polymorpha TaxID=45954 RepID=UPI0022649BD1|nr:roundabout homolog 1-like [Dreissena polymorpha]